jgi:predicted RNA-binding Zn-ribbon protein involved in translation (DUF1610 family)
MRCPNCNREIDPQELIEGYYCPDCYEELREIGSPYGPFYDDWGDDSNGS